MALVGKQRFEKVTTKSGSSQPALVMAVASVPDAPESSGAVDTSGGVDASGAGGESVSAIGEHDPVASAADPADSVVSAPDAAGSVVSAPDPAGSVVSAADPAGSVASVPDALGSRRCPTSELGQAAVVPRHERQHRSAGTAGAQPTSSHVRDLQGKRASRCGRARRRRVAQPWDSRGPPPLPATGAAVTRER